MALRVETKRLIIRHWTESDIEPYAELVADPNVMQHIGNGQTRDRAYAEAFVHRMIQTHDERGWIRFAVELAETETLMGFSGFAPDGDVVDFGWRYGSAYWGFGYGSEAGLAALKIGREQYGLYNIEAKSYPDNIGSIVIMKKMGMSYLRESREFGKRVVHYGFADE